MLAWLCCYLHTVPREFCCRSWGFSTYASLAPGQIDGVLDQPPNCSRLFEAFIHTEGVKVYMRGRPGLTAVHSAVSSFGAYHLPKVEEPTSPFFFFGSLRACLFFEYKGCRRNSCEDRRGPAYSGAATRPSPPEG